MAFYNKNKINNFIILKCSKLFKLFIIKHITYCSKICKPLALNCQKIKYINAWSYFFLNTKLVSANSKINNKFHIYSKLITVNITSSPNNCSHRLLVVDTVFITVNCKVTRVKQKFQNVYSNHRTRM